MVSENLARELWDAVGRSREAPARVSKDAMHEVGGVKKGHAGSDSPFAPSPHLLRPLADVHVSQLSMILSESFEPIIQRSVGPFPK